MTRVGCRNPSCLCTDSAVLGFGGRGGGGGLAQLGMLNGLFAAALWSEGWVERVGWTSRGVGW